MKKWVALGALLLALVAGYAVAGPYLAIRGIHRCLETRQLDELHRFVDFDALRANMRAQVDDRLLRAAGPHARGELAQLAIGVIGQVSDHAVNALVSPTGIAVLLEGRALARRASGDAGSDAARPGEPDAKASGYRPLDHARTRFESPSRFTATVPGASGSDVVFVFTRKGLAWKLSDVQLPPDGLPGS
jgi:hypothetical protein